MTSLFTSAGYSIDPVAGTITDPKGQPCKMRPQTFRLLLLFLSRAGENLSKQVILEQAWPDVVVGEHVVFQSIKEIRQTFAPLEVIKTVPRQGYTWLQPVMAEDSDSLVVSPDNATTGRNNAMLALLSGICVLLLGALIWISQQPQHSVSGSIVVLPVRATIDDADHQWVRLGAMDQLIQRLASGRDNGVLHTDYVLEIMHRAQLSVSEDREAIDKIFQVSGASLIVATTLKGTPNDYQLLYSLHRRTGVNKGVVFANNISEAVSQMAHVVARYSGLELNSLPVDYQSGFANEMIANALVATEGQGLDSAIPLLQAAVASETDNLTARRLLLQTFVMLGDVPRSDALLQQVQPQLAALTKPDHEQVRILFWAGLNELHKMDTVAAEDFFARTEALARQLNDWLYLAYIAEIRGEVAHQLQQFEQAQQHYLQAKSFHKVLHCPFGESNILLNLSQLANEQQRPQEAQALLHQALTLITQRQLKSLEQRALNWQRQLSGANDA